MESPDIKKLRKQIRELRASSNVGSAVAKMSAEQLQNEISYHETANKAIINKAKRTKKEPEVESKPVKTKLVKREVELVIPAPKKRAVRKYKVESEGSMSDLEIEKLEDVKPKIVSKKKTPVNLYKELPELKKNVKKAEPEEKAVRRLTNTKNLLRRPYSTADSQEDQ